MQKFSPLFAIRPQTIVAMVLSGLVPLKQKQLKSKMLLLTLLLCMLASGSALAQIYVSKTNGFDDPSRGSEGQPFATIQYAHDRASGGQTIYVGPGVYREQVNISKGGLTFRPVNLPGLNQPSDVTINGTDLITTPWTSAGNGIYQTDPGTIWKNLYSPRDIQKGGYGERPDAGGSNVGYGENQLFQGENMLHVLRWPHNTSSDVALPTMARVTTKISDTYGNGSYYGQGTGGRRTRIATTGFTSQNTDINAWVGAYIFVNTSRNGVDGQGYVGRVTYVAENVIEFDYFKDGPDSYQISGPSGGGYGTEFYLFDPEPQRVSSSNIGALLGPGEWYKDETILYVRGYNGNSGMPNTGSNPIYTKNRYFGFAGNGAASGYRIEGFNLFACTAVTSYNFESTEAGASSSNNVVFDNLRVKYVTHSLRTGNYQNGHSGWTGLVMNGSNHTVSNCVIQYSSSSAISLEGSYHQCVNNKIYDTNYIIGQSAAINTGRTAEALDLNIEGNTISNTTHCAINISKLRNSNINNPGAARVHHNTIVDYCQRTGDDGAIHEFGRDLQWARIDHNYIYNTRGHDLLAEGQGIHGVYFDYGDWKPDHSGTGEIHAIVDHNVITNVQTAILVNSGKSVRIYNNVLIGNGAPFPNGQYSIGNYMTEYDYNGTGWYVFNNIMSHPVSTVI